MHGRRLRNSLQAYLLILMLGVILPVQAVGGGVLLGGARQVQKNTVQRTEQALSGAADAVNTQVSSLFRQQHSYLVDSTSLARRALALNESSAPSDRWILLRSLMSELSWLSRYNDLVTENRLYYPTLGFSLGGSYQSLTAEEWAQMAETAFPVLSAQEDRLIVSAAYPANYSGDVLMLYRTVISLDELRRFAEIKLPCGSCLLYLNGEYLAGPEEAPEALRGGLPENGARIRLEGGTYYTFVSVQSAYGFTLVNLIPARELDANSQYLFTLIAVYGLLSALLLAVFAYILSRHVHRPIRRLLQGFEQVREGALDVQIEACGPEEFFELTDGFNQMVRSLSEAMQTICDQKTYAQQMRLKQLQAQINPHFLYNTFFMLERLVDDEEFDAARATCRYLGEYFRYITYTASGQTLLREEYAHAMNYLQLQKLRYEERLIIDADALPQALWDCEVPRLILQPVLENAFNHGFSQGDAHMQMRIRIQTEGGDVRFVFENSASQPPLHALGLELDSRMAGEETTGMLNIHQRMRLLYGPPYGLALKQSELGGLRVELCFPARRSGEHGDV